MLNSQEILEKLTDKTKQLTGRKYVSANQISEQILTTTGKVISASAIARLADIDRVPYKSSAQIYADFLGIPPETIKQKTAAYSPRRTIEEINKDPLLIHIFPVFFWSYYHE